MKDYSLFRAYAEVDLDIIRENIKNINAALSENAVTVGVIKADAYGHGALRVAKAICDLVGAFAVATPEEALEIRSSIKDTPILILGYSHPDAFEDLIKNDIIPAIFRYSDAQLLSETAIKLKKTASINIKLDTGMGRIGFACSNETVDEIERISKLEKLHISGVFTHFSTADSSDESDRAFSKEQHEKLLSFINSCAERGIVFEHISASNSAALIEMPETHQSQVRAGILLYGYYPSQQVRKTVKVTPALSLHSHIIQIKEVDKDFPVGYGRAYVSNRPIRIATVPVGYGDGYPRLLSNKGRVLIRGEYAPIIGRICMDMFMVDVTHIPDAAELDEVVLLGVQGQKSIDADEIAHLTDTISYEIICDIGKRVPRVYKSK